MGEVKKTDLALLAVLTLGAATFFYAVLRRRSPNAFPYSWPRGGERDGEFELFIGS